MSRCIKETIYEHCINNVAKMHLLEEFDTTKNNCTVYDTSINNSKVKVWWYCKKCNYSWQELPYNRKNYPATPCCNGKHATMHDNFKVNYSELMKDWDYNKNTLKPESLKSNSHEEVWFKCHRCNTEWSTRVDYITRLYNRYGHNGCKTCSSKQTSKAELVIYTLLKQTFKNTKHRYKINGIEYDIFIPEINVAIEYDGIVWHKNKLESHIKKLNNAKNNNIKLINIMEYIKGKDKPLENYTLRHNVIEFEIDYNYDITKPLIDCIINLFNNQGIKLERIDETYIDDNLNDIRNNINKQDSLYTKYPWLKNWFSENNKFSIDEYKKADQRYIDLVCPECGDIRNIKVHYIPRSFRGCTKCGCKRHIPEDYLARIYAADKRCNEKKKRNNK